MRIFILLLAILIRGGILFAQEKDTVARHFRDQNTDLQDYPKRFVSKIEIFGGPNVSWFWGDESLRDRVGRIDYSAGMGFYHSLNEKFDINAKVLLERKGHKNDHESTYYDNSNIPIAYRFIQGSDLKYYSVSILPIYNFGLKKHLSFGCGVYGSLLNSAKTWTETYTNGQYIGYYYADNTSSYKKYDLGFSFIVGYKIVVNDKISFNIQLLNNLGLLNIRNPDIPATPIKNNVLSILITITLNR